MATRRQRELRRKRSRKQKLARLRRQYSAARTQDERARIFEKVRRVTPGLAIETFLGQPKTARR